MQCKNLVRNDGAKELFPVIHPALRFMPPRHSLLKLC